LAFPSSKLQKKLVKAKSFKEKFLLRGIINCENHNANLTGSASRSKNGTHHHYYHCNHFFKARMRVTDPSGSSANTQYQQGLHPTKNQATL